MRTLAAESDLWPRYRSPEDLEQIEAVPLEARGLPSSTYELLERAASTWPDRTAVLVLPDAAHWEDPSPKTFAELLAAVRRTANALLALGVTRGQAVVLLSPNCADLVPTILAAQLAGVAAPINQSLGANHVAELLRLAGTRVLVSAGPELDPPTWELAQDLAHRGLVDTLIVLRPTGAAGAAPALGDIPGVTVAHLAELVDDHDATTFHGTPPTASDLASLFHTGGTTGTPKLAAHTHANEVIDAWMIAANEELGTDAVVLAALPLFHVNALVVTLLAPLFKGQQVLWAGPLGYRDVELYGVFWRMVERYRLAAMSAVPTVYAVLAGVPVDADISSLRFAMVGASPLPPAVRSGFEAHTGVSLVEGYGLTEATCASARSFPGAPRPGSVGQRLPYQQVRVVEVTESGHRPLPAGEIGILAISGPTVFPGYVVERTGDGFVLDGLGKLVEGWLDTGDLARVDAEGFIQLTGRAKDLIIRGGHNIDPAVIEDVLLAHPDVTAAGAVGYPDPHAGEVPVAFVSLVPGARVDGPALAAWAADRITEPSAAPRTVTVLASLPVTDVGKPYKLELRRLATQSAVEDVLREVDGVDSITTSIGNGAIDVLVRADGGPAVEAAERRLSRYTMAHRVDLA